MTFAPKAFAYSFNLGNYCSFVYSFGFLLLLSVNVKSWSLFVWLRLRGLLVSESVFVCAFGSGQRE